MSWFSDFFGKLFGRSGSQPVPAPDKRRRVRQAAPAKVVVDAGSGTTLGQVFRFQGVSDLPKDRLRPANAPAIAADVRERLRAQISRIPPMPEIWQRVQQVLQQPDASASDLAQCVCEDPILTARILTVCNSAIYASQRTSEITNINLAIARLGLEESSSIIFQTLAPQLGGSDYKRAAVRHLWFHSRAISRLASILAEPSGTPDRHTAALAGMLHDIGKLVMVHIESEEDLLLLKQRLDEGADALASEYALFGYTHIDAGIMLALHWHLPRYVKSMIQMHHHPDALDADQLPADMRALTMTLHASHLILNHLDAEAKVGAKQVDAGDQTAIWQYHQRHVRKDTAGFIHTALEIPLASSSLYDNICSEVTRLRKS